MNTDVTQPTTTALIHSGDVDIWIKQCQQRDPEWLYQLRQRALESYQARGLPGNHLESWKYTRIDSQIVESYHLAKQPSPSIDGFPLPLSALAQYRIVLVNGYIDHTLTHFDKLAEGVSINSLRHTLDQRPDLLKRLLQQQFHETTDGLHALNIALMSDGLVIQIEEDCVLEKPLHIIHVSDATQPLASHSFNFIHLGKLSQASIIETFCGRGSENYFRHLHSSIQLEQGSLLTYYKLQKEANSTTHIARRDILQASNSHLVMHNIALGSHIMRDELNVKLVQPGAVCELNGLFIANDKHHHDCQLRVMHQAPRCLSREFYRGIADQRGHGVFDGRVVVSQYAQQSDAMMSSKNLLLSPHAEIDVKPHLEIYADDVKCAHGATVGQVNEDALFYLETRGFDEVGARSLLTFAFANEVLDKISDHTVKMSLQNEALAQLPHNEAVRGTEWR